MRHVFRASGTRITGLWRSLALAGWLWLAQLAGWLWLELELAGSGSGSGCQGGRTAAQAWAGLGAWVGWWLAGPGGWLGAWWLAGWLAPGWWHGRKRSLFAPQNIPRGRPKRKSLIFPQEKPHGHGDPRNGFPAPPAKHAFFHRKRSLFASQKLSKKPSRARITHFSSVNGPMDTATRGPGTQHRPQNIHFSIGNAHFLLPNSVPRHRPKRQTLIFP